MLRKLNHITLAVSDLDRSFHFYVSVLGFKPRAKWSGGAYLTLDRLWFCLLAGKVNPSGDYTHLAFELQEPDFNKARDLLIRNRVKQWQENNSEGDSFYFLDPDGRKLEIHSGNLDSRLRSMKSEFYKDLRIF